MKEFGLISNRIFDVLGAGGRLVTDSVAGVSQLFPDAIREVSSAAELGEVIANATDGVAGRQAATELVRNRHTFDHRVRQMIGDLFDFLELEIDERHPRSEIPWAAAQLSTDTRNRSATTSRSETSLKVGAVVLPGGSGYQSSAYIRLLSPLTSSAMTGTIDVLPVVDVERLPLSELDAVIIQRHSLQDLDTARAFVADLAKHDVRLLLDNDDALALLDQSHPEYSLLRQKSQVIEYLLGEADHAWFSTEELMKTYGPSGSASVMPNSLDPRLWRRYRYPRPTPTDGPLQVLYTGTATHDADFDLVLDAFDAWAPSDGFELTLIGAVRNPPQRQWLRVVPVPQSEGSYSRFVRWLLDQGPFDIGVSPLVDNPFNRAKSDIKFLDYLGLGTLPVLSDLLPYQGDAQTLKLAEHASGAAASWLAALDSAAEHCRETDRRQQAFEYLWANRTAAATGKRMLEEMRKVLHR
jgi:hypothetical protein